MAYLVRADETTIPASPASDHDNLQSCKLSSVLKCAELVHVYFIYLFMFHCSKKKKTPSQP